MKTEESSTTAGPGFREVRFEESVVSEVCETGPSTISEGPTP